MTEITPQLDGELRGALAAICSIVGLDPTGAELIKYTNNATYRLKSRQLVVRLGLGQLATTRAHHVAAVARWLTDHDAPVVRMLDGLEQPVRSNGYVATIWIALPPPDPARTGVELAVPLREIHRIPAPSAFPEWDPFSSARQRLAVADGLDHDDQQWLTEQWSEAESDYRRIKSGLRFGLVHGDAHVGNLLREPSGRYVLCDLDGTCRGPVLYDLVPAAVGGIRFGAVRDHTALADAYRLDVTTQPAWPVLRRIRELVLVTSVVPDLRRRPEIAALHARRLATLRSGESALWTRYR